MGGGGGWWRLTRTGEDSDEDDRQRLAVQVCPLAAEPLNKVPQLSSAEQPVIIPLAAKRVLTMTQLSRRRQKTDAESEPR